MRRILAFNADCDRKIRLDEILYALKIDSSITQSVISGW